MRVPSATGLGVAALALALNLSSRTWGGEKDKKAPAKGEKDKVAWKSLFDGKSLTGWKAINFGGEGEVHVKDKAVVMEQGDSMTGVTYTRGDFPKMDYEIVVEGKRVAGNDFVCTTTFPVGDTYCS